MAEDGNESSPSQRELVAGLETGKKGKFTLTERTGSGFRDREKSERSPSQRELVAGFEIGKKMKVHPHRENW